MIEHEKTYKPKDEMSSLKYKSRKEAVDDHVKNYNSDGISKGKGDRLSSDYYRVHFIVAHVPDESHVLDVGCNGGTIPVRLLGNKRCYVRGIDVVPELVEKAKKRGVFAEVGEAENLSRYDDDEFDVVICTEVLEHLFDPVVAVKEAYRVLKPGGRYIVTVPAPGSEMCKDGKHGDYHQTNFTMETLDVVFYSCFKRDSAKGVMIPYSEHYIQSVATSPEEFDKMSKTGQWLGVVITK